LSIGYGPSLTDVETMVLGSSFEFDVEEPPSESTNFRSDRDHTKYSSVLRPMNDAVQLCKLRRRLSSITLKTLIPKLSSLRYLDIRSMDVNEKSKIGGSVLLATCSSNVEIIEIGEYLSEKDGLRKLCSAVGWRMKDCRGRLWIERK